MKRFAKFVDHASGAPMLVDCFDIVGILETSHSGVTLLLTGGQELEIRGSLDALTEAIRKHRDLAEAERDVREHERLTNRARHMYSLMETMLPEMMRLVQREQGSAFE